MRILISFFLSVFFYVLVVLFLFLTFNKKVSKKEVLIHTAIVVNTKETVKNSYVSKKFHSSFQIKKTEKIHKKTKPKNSKSKVAKSPSSFTRSGNSDFKDIFKKVSYNVDTEKLNFKKELDLSRFKGIEKKLKNIKFINFEVSYTKSSGKMDEKEIKNLIVKKLGPVWNSVSDVVGEYAKINIIYDGSVKVYIIDTNLPEEKQKILVEKIKELKFDKKFNITVKFVTKVKK